MARSDSAKWHRYLRFWRANLGADVDDELAFHSDARVQELRERGLSLDAARAEALREFGDVEHMRNTLRAMDERHAATARRLHFADDLLRDASVALRGLRRSPGLVAVVTLTFALGIGVTSAIYSVVDTYLFRPLPGRDAAALVVLGRTDRGIPLPHDLSFPDFQFYRADTTTFSALAAYTGGGAVACRPRRRGPRSRRTRAHWNARTRRRTGTRAPSWCRSGRRDRTSAFPLWRRRLRWCSWCWCCSCSSWRAPTSRAFCWRG